jgi:lipoprotein-releasing system permease protein
VRAVEPGYLNDPGSRAYLEVLEGEGTLSGGSDGAREVLLGSSLAEITGAEVGKSIYIMSIRSSASGGSVPRTLPYTVKGIVSSGYHELDALWCIMSWDGGIRLLDPAMSSSYLTVKVSEPHGTGAASIDNTAYILSDLLGIDYGVFSWRNLLRSHVSSYDSMRQLLIFIMALIVLIAAVNVSSSSSMLVIDRRRDIAVLKAIGASPGFIRRIFLLASFLTGFTGAVFGTALGLLIGTNVNGIIHGLESVLSFFSRLGSGGDVHILDPGYYLQNIPIIVNTHAVVLIGILAVACSVAASWFPAHRAGKLKPLDLLRRV